MPNKQAELSAQTFCDLLALIVPASELRVLVRKFNMQHSATLQCNAGEATRVSADCALAVEQGYKNATSENLF